MSKFIFPEEPLVDWDEDAELQDSVLVTEAAMVTTLTKHFFIAYNDRLLEKLNDKMRSMEVEDYCSTSAMGNLLTTHLCIENQHMVSYSIQEESSRLSIDHVNDSLSLRLSNINLQFEFDFRVWSEPEWLHDVGTGTISVTNSDINFDLGLRRGDDGHLKVEVFNE